MGRYVIRDNHWKSVKKCLLTFNEISVNTYDVVGKVRILNYRKYEDRNEVDISFIGKIRTSLRNDEELYGPNITMDPRLSICRAHSYIISQVFSSVKGRMSYFSVDLDLPCRITKIKWESDGE